MERPKVIAELDDLFDELVTVLKSEAAGETLAELGVNVSLAITAAHGLLAYLHGEKEPAAEDFETVAEEIRARLALAVSPSRELTKGKPS